MATLDPLTPGGRLGIKPTSSWILVRPVTAESRKKLQYDFFIQKNKLWCFYWKRKNPICFTHSDSLKANSGGVLVLNPTLAGGKGVVQVPTAV